MMNVSVCMAVYNGQEYLQDQLQSILKQLQQNDEVVIVDDASSDRTVSIINNFQDSRIKLIENKINLGVVKTFEKSINHASGDIIFLSDQDDIWLACKVQKFLSVFEAYPDVTLVLSDAQIIDEKGQITADSFFKIRGEFVANPLSNWIKSKHHGCTLAFRREMLKLFLPFPADTPMHDIWIGIVNGIYGKAFYIDEPLIQHRRHTSNTGRGIFNHAGILQMVNWRLVLAKNIISLLLKQTSKY
ncbi:glycosyltransferase family 2 protein [Nostoc sp. T09]|uniref:glycosyltransferase family 2 protein n=1 Tax=Nostoc sp. T09 TaxID=1932621 RepID=UPI000A36DA7A|nr:glycosyltransferase family 2 protein [Nostoc sp. T09]